MTGIELDAGHMFSHVNLCHSSISYEVLFSTTQVGKLRLQEVKTGY